MHGLDQGNVLGAVYFMITQLFEHYEFKQDNI